MLVLNCHYAIKTTWSESPSIGGFQKTSVAILTKTLETVIDFLSRFSVNGRVYGDLGQEK